MQSGLRRNRQNKRKYAAESRKISVEKAKKNEEQVDACYVEPRVSEKSRENRMEKINTVENCVWA